MESKKETAAGLEGVTSAERSLLGARSAGGDNARQPATAAAKPAVKASDAQAQKKAAVSKKRHPAVSVLRWLLLKSIVPVLCVLAVLGGMYIGYTVLGKQSGDEVFQVATWKHMYDLIFAD